VSGARIVAQKALALLTSLVVMGLALMVTTLASSVVFDLGIDPASAASGSLSMILLGAEFGGIALAAGTISGSRAWAIAIGTVGAVAAYVLYAAGALVEAVRPWKPLSPFHQALEGGPLGAGLPARYLLPMTVAIVVVLIALPMLDRRDIAAHA
jgi:ABC-2 type transport system permease protein